MLSAKATGINARRNHGGKALATTAIVTTLGMSLTFVHIGEQRAALALWPVFGAQSITRGTGITRGQHLAGAQWAAVLVYRDQWRSCQNSWRHWCSKRVLDRQHNPIRVINCHQPVVIGIGAHHHPLQVLSDLRHQHQHQRTDHERSTDSLANWFNVELDAGRARDYGPNGVQIGNGGVVTKLASACTASLAVIAQAQAAGADGLLVHHGLLGQGRSNYRIPTTRAEALSHDIALFAYHLPRCASDLGQ